MVMMIIFTSIISMISFIMMMLASIISKKTFMDREKISAFECGFDPKDSPRLPFNPHFFLIAVIFLIFDVEITLLFPLILNFKISLLNNYFFILLFFILILIFGLYHEWSQGALKWNF